MTVCGEKGGVAAPIVEGLTDALRAAWEWSPRGAVPKRGRFLQPMRSMRPRGHQALLRARERASSRLCEAWPWLQSRGADLNERAARLAAAHCMDEADAAAARAAATARDAEAGERRYDAAVAKRAHKDERAQAEADIAARTAALEGVVVGQGPIMPGMVLNLAAGADAVRNGQRCNYVLRQRPADVAFDDPPYDTPGASLANKRLEVQWDRSELPYVQELRARLDVARGRLHGAPPRDIARMMNVNGFYSMRIIRNRLNKTKGG